MSAHTAFDAAVIALTVIFVWVFGKSIRPFSPARPWWTAPEPAVLDAVPTIGLRDYQATHAPEPTISDLREVCPPPGRLSVHDDGYIRWRIAARAAWAYHYADLMAAQRAKGGAQ